MRWRDDCVRSGRKSRFEAAGWRTTPKLSKGAGETSGGQYCSCRLIDERPRWLRAMSETKTELWYDDLRSGSVGVQSLKRETSPGGGQTSESARLFADDTDAAERTPAVCSDGAKPRERPVQLAP